MLDDAIIATLRAEGPMGVPRLCRAPDVQAAARVHAPASFPDNAVLFRLQALALRGVVRQAPHQGWSVAA